MFPTVASAYLYGVQQGWLVVGRGGVRISTPAGVIAPVKVGEREREVVSVWHVLYSLVCWRRGGVETDCTIVNYTVRVLS